MHVLAVVRVVPLTALAVSKDYAATNALVVLDVECQTEIVFAKI
jgi:hypothetical protein